MPLHTNRLEFQSIELACRCICVHVVSAWVSLSWHEHFIWVWAVNQNNSYNIQRFTQQLKVRNYHGIKLFIRVWYVIVVVIVNINICNNWWRWIMQIVSHFPIIMIFIESTNTLCPLNNNIDRKLIGQIAINFTHDTTSSLEAKQTNSNNEVWKFVRYYNRNCWQKANAHEAVSSVNLTQLTI